jgi:preprotein translocase subunit SecE
MVSRIKNYFKEVKVEFRHLNWPTRKEATKLTIVVISFSLILAVFLGLFDFIFSNLIKLILK